MTFIPNQGAHIMGMPNPFPSIQFPNTPNPAINQVIVPTSYNITKAGTKGALIAVVLDESGSMNSCRAATISGYNEFIAGQKSAQVVDAEGKLQKAFVTLNKFEGGHIRTLYSKLDIMEVPQLDNTTYTPCGGTNLLDAIGKTIQDINTQLSSIEESERPSVIISIMTDGAENQSRTFNYEQIRTMVRECETNNWSFMFLGANIDAFSTGAMFGMNASNTIQYSTSNMSATMATLSDSTTRVRCAYAKGLGTEAVYASAMFTDEERNKVK